MEVKGKVEVVMLNEMNYEAVAMVQAGKQNYIVSLKFVDTMEQYKVIESYYQGREIYPERYIVLDRY